jgi:hypothetical protein
VYAWGSAEHDRWVRKLSEDLLDLGIRPRFDRWDNGPGTSITEFLDLIDLSDYVLVVGTPALKAKYQSSTTESVARKELELVQARLREPLRKHTVLTVLRQGTGGEAFPFQLKDRVYIDMRSERGRAGQLFEILTHIFNFPRGDGRYLQTLDRLREEGSL